MQTVTPTASSVNWTQPANATLAHLVAWFEARGYTVSPSTGKATKVSAPAPSQPDYFQQRAQKRARMKARRQEASKAMQLYARDHAAARAGERSYPKIVDYVGWTWVDGPREQLATDYAKSRFGELR
jgi:rRNA maturation protein Nop10